MTDRIVRTFMGTHLDLSKIVSISDAQFIDRMGYGGWYVSFEIIVQLSDNPIIYTRKFDYDEYTYNEKHELVYWKYPNGRESKIPLAVKRLQDQIDGLVKQWRQVAA